MIIIKFIGGELNRKVWQIPYYHSVIKAYNLNSEELYKFGSQDHYNLPIHEFFYKDSGFKDGKGRLLFIPQDSQPQQFKSIRNLCKLRESELAKLRMAQYLAPACAA
jgi:hypothetical protein